MDEFTPFKVEHRIVLRRRDGAVGPLQGSDRARCRGSAGAPARHRAGHHRTEGRRGRAAPPGVARPAHRAAEPAAAGRPPRPGAYTVWTGRPTIVGVIHLDIDRFKVINDSLGHAAGDQLLLAIAHALAELVRPDDTLARIDGDEFVVLCEGLSGRGRGGRHRRPDLRRDDRTPRVGRRGARHLGQRRHRARDLRRRWTRTRCCGTPTPPCTAPRARAAPARPCSRRAMRARAVGRLDTEMSLRQSIANGDLRVHYQPIVNLVDGQVLGHEALVRWEHPTRGLLGPDEFITDRRGDRTDRPARRVGAARGVPAGEAVPDPRPAVAAPDDVGEPVRRPARSTRPRRADRLGAAATPSSRPEHLQLEMTESVLMDDAPTTITILRDAQGSRRPARRRRLRDRATRRWPTCGAFPSTS